LRGEQEQLRLATTVGRNRLERGNPVQKEAGGFVVAWIKRKPSKLWTLDSGLWTLDFGLWTGVTFGNIGGDEGGFAKASGGGDQGKPGAGQRLQPFKEAPARNQGDGRRWNIELGLQQDVSHGR
jgi:hypothetical protein